MSFLEFMDRHCLVSIVLLIILAMTAGGIVETIFRAYKCRQRSRNIVAQGWPPPHLDADGDWKQEPKAE